MKDITLEVLFPEGKPISKEKKNDLLKMKNIMPQESWSFYESIINDKTVDEPEHVHGLNDCDMIHEE